MVERASRRVQRGVVGREARQTSLRHPRPSSPLTGVFNSLTHSLLTELLPKLLRLLTQASTLFYTLHPLQPQPLIPRSLRPLPLIALLPTHHSTPLLAPLPLPPLSGLPLRGLPAAPVQGAGNPHASGALDLRGQPPVRHGCDRALDLPVRQRSSRGSHDRTHTI
jgi:hypothetical protein